MPTLTFSKYDLRVLETFDATHVEGPVRLFDRRVRFPVTLGEPADLTLPVSGQAQIQKWAVDNDGEAAQVSRDKYPGVGFRNSDLEQPALEVVDVPHTADGYDGDIVAHPDHHWPRTRSCRIVGGYVLIHGDVGKAARYFKFPSERAP